MIDCNVFSCKYCNKYKEKCKLNIIKISNEMNNKCVCTNYRKRLSK